MPTKEKPTINTDWNFWRKAKCITPRFPVLYSVPHLMVASAWYIRSFFWCVSGSLVFVWCEIGDQNPYEEFGVRAKAYRDAPRTHHQPPPSSQYQTQSSGYKPYPSSGYPPGYPSGYPSSGHPSSGYPPGYQPNPHGINCFLPFPYSLAESQDIVASLLHRVQFISLFLVLWKSCSMVLIRELSTLNSF